MTITIPVSKLFARSLSEDDPTGVAIVANDLPDLKEGACFAAFGENGPLLTRHHQMQNTPLLAQDEDFGSLIRRKYQALAPDWFEAYARSVPAGHGAVRRAPDCDIRRM